MKIAISKGSGSEKYKNYQNWLKKADSNAEYIDMSEYSPEEAKEKLAGCSGLLLTGGEDVDPLRYGRTDNLEEKNVETDPKRDELEFALVEKAEEMRMPILGICRGFQLLNIAHGGTLIVDIPSDYKTDLPHSKKENKDGIHPVEISQGSLLKKIVGQEEGTINSAHHQAIEKLSPDFSPSAKSPDGIVEALEWRDPGGKPFLLAVQWHPERLDFESPFSQRLAEHFLFEAQSYSLLHGAGNG